MHIPGHGFLSSPVSVSLALASLSGLGLTVRTLVSSRAGKFFLRMASLAAFIFAAQMFNYPVANGTSGHLIGAALAAALVGPAAATLVMTAVLLVQCALFGDGGWLSLGANVFNMGIVAVWVGWAFYRGFGTEGTLSRYLALFVGSWASVVAAASACSLEIALSGTAKLSTVLPAMIGAHAGIGVGEGAIAVAAYAFVGRFAQSPMLASATEGKAY